MKKRKKSDQRWLISSLLVVFLAISAVSWLVFSYLNRPRPVDPLALTGEYDLAGKAGTFNGTSVEVPPPLPDTLASVLGTNGEDKRIEVDLTNQRLYAFEGSRKVYDFLISSGKWNKTPTGTFRIWGKFRYTRMTGGNPLWHTFYDLPNVPFVMFFGSDQVAPARGFSLHGTYWHSNFGHPMSHGCVNMRTSEAAILYDWTSPSVGSKKAVRASIDDPGTPITIYGETPAE